MDSNIIWLCRLHTAQDISRERFESYLRLNLDDTYIACAGNFVSWCNVILSSLEYSLDTGECAFMVIHVYIHVDFQLCLIARKTKL